MFLEIGYKNCNADGYVYSGEKNSDAIEILGTDAVFATNCDYYFLNGGKLRYSDFGAVAYEDENGIAMVPCTLLAKALNINITCNSEKIIANDIEIKIGESQSLDAPAIIKNGVYYVPIVSFTKNILGKYAYSDGRGFVIVSDKERDYSDSEQASKTEEKSDIISRYILFDRPSGDDILNAVKKHSGNMHPRMFVRADEIENFRSTILENELHSLMEKCEKHILSPVVPFEFTDYEGPRLIAQFRKVRDVLFDLCVAYLATGGEKFSKRLWEECENVLTWDDWNLSDDGSGFLDASEVGAALAFSYDVLYNELSNEEKDFFRNSIEEKYIDYCVGVMEGKKHFKISDGRMRHSNWGAVCTASMFLVAMAFIDDLPEGEVLTEKCKFLATGALRALEFPAYTLYPDGAIHEGLEYWMFYVKNLAWSVKALYNMCGEDYGFLSVRGLKESIKYALNIQTVNGGFNYLSTSGEGKQLFPELYAIADLYNDNDLMHLLKKYITAAGIDTGARGILFYKDSQSNACFEDLALDNYFQGEKITTMRADYDDRNAAYVAILGGFNGTDSHYDKGSFIFEVGGERWISDIGGERKDVYGGYYHAEGWNLYRKRTEGHNSLVINPYDNSIVKEFINQNLNNGYNVNCDDPRYVGQTIGSVAQLSRFESKEKGAIAVYDLKDAYGSQVNSYQRGFYLGDDRSSLILRDEFILRGENSSLYWGLHTLGTIKELGSDYAVIEKNGKRLRVQILTNIKDFVLTDVAAEPMDTSMIRGVGVEGVYKEFSRDNIRKLMLSGKGSGEVYIAAKFSLEGDASVAPFENSSISSWEIPDGACKVSLPKPYEDFKITSQRHLVADADGEIVVTADVPYRADRIEMFVNNEKVIDKSDDFKANGKESFIIYTNDFDSSNLDIRIDYIKGGDKVSVSQSVIVYSCYKTDYILNKTFEELLPDDSARDVHYKIMDDICLYFSLDGFRAQGDGNGNLKLLFDGSGEGSAGYLYKKELQINPGNALNISWVLSTNDFIKMYVSAKDIEGEKTVPSRIDQMPVYFGTHIYEMFLDGDNYKYTVKNLKGEYVHTSTGSMKSTSGGFSEFHLKFYSVTPENSLILQTVAVSELKYNKVFTDISFVNEGTRISLSRNDDMKIVKVIYSGEDKKIESVNFVNGNETVVEKNKEAAIFVWNKSLVKPYCKCFKIVD